MKDLSLYFLLLHSTNNLHPLSSFLSWFYPLFFSLFLHTYFTKRTHTPPRANKPRREGRLVLGRRRRRIATAWTVVYWAYRRYIRAPIPLLSGMSGRQHVRATGAIHSHALVFVSSALYRISHMTKHGVLFIMYGP